MIAVPKVKLSVEDDNLIEERNGAKTRISLTEVTAFNVIHSRFGAIWMRVKIKGVVGSVRYTPMKLFGKQFDDFLEFADDLTFAVKAHNLEAKIDEISGIDNPELAEVALKTPMPISTKLSFGLRVWKVVQVILVSIAALLFLFAAIGYIHKGKTIGYLFLIPFIYFFGSMIFDWIKKKRKK
jgi:hypothetical protein